MPRLPRALTLLLPLALLLSAPVASGANEPATASERMAPGLRAKAATQGRIRVLVELEEGFAPEGRMRGALRDRQRRGIALRRERVLERLGPKARSARRFETIPWVAVEVGADGLDELSRSADVRSIQLDLWLTPQLSDSLPRVQADVVQTGYDGSGSAIVVIDSGVDPNHEFLAGKTIASAEACFSAGSDCPNGQTSQLGAGAAIYCSWASEGCSHGTHVSGIAVGNDGAGRVGTAPGADLIPIRVSTESSDAGLCGPTGELPCALTQTSDLILALEHAYALRTSHSIAAVNVSLGGGQWSNQALCDAQNAATKAAIDNLLSAGIPTVVAAGNSGFDDAITAPACISSAVAVGASTDHGSIPGWTNWAPFLALVAPGTAVESSVPFALKNSLYKFRTGTSMAAPHVAGAIAVLHEALPGSTGPDLVADMIATGPLLTHNPTGQMKPQLDLLAALDASLDPCDNGVDDDLDTFFDHPDDSGCSAPTDADERSTDACDNGIDDDGDGLTDFPADPGCYLPMAATEAPQCDDDLDNDGDGSIDWDGGSGGGSPDPQCTTGALNKESSACGLGFEAGLALLLVHQLARTRRSRR